VASAAFRRPQTHPQPVENHAYLRGRVAQVFDRGSQHTPRWTVTDAHAVRALLDELRRLQGAR
jgi:hypothetical protein